MSDPTNGETIRETLDPAEYFGAESPCFGCSPDHAIGFHLHCARVTSPEGQRSIETELVPGAQYQGPPGVMHGGLVMTLADEVAAWTVIGLTSRFGFTAAMSCKLHRPVRIGQPVAGRGTIASASLRIVKVEITLSQSGDLAFAGDFTFALLDASGAERLLGGPLPEAWRRFARSPQSSSGGS